MCNVDAEHDNNADQIHLLQHQNEQPHELSVTPSLNDHNRSDEDNEQQQVLLSKDSSFELDEQETSRKLWCGGSRLVSALKEPTTKQKISSQSDHDRNFYDPKGYNNVLHKMQTSKKYQDSVSKILKARAKIEKMYSESLCKWHSIAEKEIQGLDVYPHERLFLDIILSRDAKISTACSTLSSHISTIAEEFHKRSDIFFGSARFGSLENVKDLSSKFKVAQKHWMMHLRELENARSHLANHSLNLTRMQRKYLQMTTANPNLASPENKKMKERIEESHSEQIRLNKRYGSLCAEVETEKELYVNMMSEQYQAFVNIEKKRFQFNFAQLNSYFQKLEITSQEISMASLYSDMKDCLDEMDPSIDYRRFCETKGAHSMLKLPIEEDIVTKINKASDDLSQAATSVSQMSTKEKRKSGLSLQIETTVGKSSEMKPEIQRPDIDFAVEKFRQSIVERSKKAQEQSEKLQKESNINPNKSLKELNATIEQ